VSEPSAFLFRRESPLSLAVLRIAYGMTMFWQLSLLEDYIVGELAHSRFFVTYDFFHWVRLPGAEALGWMFPLLYVAAAAVALGLFFRPAIVVLTVGWTWLFLSCRGHYTNHYYLFCLLGMMLAASGADRALSIDRRRRGSGGRMPGSVPGWQIDVFKAQVVLVYFFGGVAKLEADWLTGWPMRIWLAERSDYAWVGWLFHYDATALAMAWAGTLFDLVIGFALWNDRTRRWAVAPLLFFHLLNAYLWDIGTFPWFMLGATTIFFPPDWPARLLGRPAGRTREAARADEASAGVGCRRAVLAGLAVWFAIQTALPLRRFLYPGNPSWTGLGHTFAWRMLLVDRSDALRVRVDVPGEGTVGYVQVGEYLTRLQLKRMTRSPKAYVRFAHFIADEMRRNAGIEGARVYIDLERQLNARPFQPVLDATRDLAAVPYSNWRTPDYILPLDPDLRPGSAPPGDFPGSSED
jgi:vitamin K-dependent gamma-carboxylase